MFPSYRRRSPSRPKQLALWQEDSGPVQPAKPDAPVVSPPVPVNLDGNKTSPTPEMPPVPSGPIEQPPVGPLSPIPAPMPVPASPVSPIPAPMPVPAGPGAPIPAGPLEPVPGQGPNPPAAGDEKLTPEKDTGSPVPFNIMDAKRESEMTVIKGRSRLLHSSIEFTRTAVVDPKICDLIQYSPTEIGFVGKAIGTTQVTLWFRESNDPNVDTQPRSIVVHVERDLKSLAPHLKQLEDEIARLFPNSKVRLRTFGERIIVLGQARDVSEAAEILNIIRGEEIDPTGKWVSGPGQTRRELR